MTTAHKFKAGELIRPISSCDGWQVGGNDIDLEQEYLSFDIDTIALYLKVSSDVGPARSFITPRQIVLIGDKLISINPRFWASL